PVGSPATAQGGCGRMNAGCWLSWPAGKQAGTPFADLAALHYKEALIMARVIWKGAITFGLVHVPIVLHSATRVTRLDFDWIDKRDNSPVGYQRINKRTGKAIEAEHIVKGYEYEKGDYVF